MGAEPYWYFVKYQPNIEKALANLRQREFRAGRYSPVLKELKFPPGPNSLAPGAKHRTIRQACEEAGEQGTRSILDITAIGTEPSCSVAVPLDPDTVVEIFGTDQPDREMLENTPILWEYMERGQAIYTYAYKKGKPTEIMFAGYSFD
jgi:hypothetical protein